MVPCAPTQQQGGGASTGCSLPPSPSPPPPLPSPSSVFPLFTVFFQNVFESLLSRCPPLSILCRSLRRVRAAHQAPLSVGFSRQEYWSGWPFPSPGDLPDPGVEPGSPASQADSLQFEPPRKAIVCGGVLTPFFCCFSLF